MAIQIYKANQGRYVRAFTGVALGLVDLALCYYLWGILSRHLPDAMAAKLYLVYGIPAGLFLVLGTIAFLGVNKPKVVDFLVATESEMKKVSWSSKAELVGSTIVVIATVVLLAVFIFLCDVSLRYLFGNVLNLW